MWWRKRGGRVSPLRHQTDQHRFHQLNTYLLNIQPIEETPSTVSSLLDTDRMILLEED